MQKPNLTLELFIVHPLTEILCDTCTAPCGINNTQCFSAGTSRQTLCGARRFSHSEPGPHIDMIVNSFGES